MQRGQDEGVCQLPPLYLRLFLNIKICELKRQRCTVFLLPCFAKLPTFGSQILVRNRPCIDILHERKAPISFQKKQIFILFRFVFQNTISPPSPGSERSIVSGVAVVELKLRLYSRLTAKTRDSC